MSNLIKIPSSLMSCDVCGKGFVIDPFEQELDGTPTEHGFHLFCESEFDAFMQGPANVDHQESYHRGLELNAQAYELVANYRTN